MNTPTTVEVRSWARARRVGHAVPATGKLPRGVVAAWNRAHPERPYGPGRDRSAEASAYRRNYYHNVEKGASA